MKALREFFAKVVPAQKHKASGNGQPDAPSAAAAKTAAAAPGATKDRDATYDPFEKDGTLPDDIDIEPLEATIAVGGKQQFRAMAVYADGSKLDITKKVVWASSASEDVSIDANGLATAHRAKGARLQAKHPDDDLRAYVLVEVTGDKSQALNWTKIAPEKAVIESGKTLQFTAEAGYADGSRRALTQGVWSSSDEAVVTIDQNGLATAGGAMGFARISVRETPDALGSHAQVTVTVGGKKPPKPPKLKSIKISPDKATIARGAQQQFTATGVYDNKSTKDLTKLVAWSAHDEGVLLIDCNTGLATAQHGDGTTKIEAADPDTAIYGATEVTVAKDAPAQPVTLASITIEPAAATIASGAKQQFKAMGKFSDGSSKEVTAQVDWWCNDDSRISVNAQGLAVAQAAAGPVEVGAIDAESGKSATAKVTVTAEKAQSGLIDPFAPGADKPSVSKKKPGPGDPPGVLKNIMVTPAAKVSITAGETLQFTALGLFAGGPDQDITKKVEWKSSNEFHVTIDANGLAKGMHGPGTAKITAKDKATGVSDAVDVSLPEPVLKGVWVEVPDRIVGGGSFRLWPRVINSNGNQSETFSEVDIKATPSDIVSIAGAPDEKGSWLITILKPGDVTFTVKDRVRGLSGKGKTKIVPPGDGAKKVNVQIILTRFDGESMADLSAHVFFKCPGVPDVFGQGSISGDALTFTDLTLMLEGRIEVSVNGPSKGMLVHGAAPYKLSGKLLSFTAAQKAESGKTTAATAEEAAKKLGAIGTIGSNIHVENMGDVGAGKSKEPAWELTWGTEALVVDQA